LFTVYLSVVNNLSVVCVLVSAFVCLWVFVFESFKFLFCFVFFVWHATHLAGPSSKIYDWWNNKSRTADDTMPKMSTVSISIYLPRLRYPCLSSLSLFLCKSLHKLHMFTLLASTLASDYWINNTLNIYTLQLLNAKHGWFQQ
jgi:hypothetical protein